MTSGAANAHVCKIRRELLSRLDSLSAEMASPQIGRTARIPSP